MTLEDSLSAAERASGEATSEEGASICLLQPLGPREISCAKWCEDHFTLHVCGRR
jgi:hypothetical protein